MAEAEAFSKLAPAIQASVIFAIVCVMALFGFGVWKVFGNVLGKIEVLHKDAMATMKENSIAMMESSKATYALATQVGQSNIRIDRLHDDVRELKQDVKSLKVQSGECYADRYQRDARLG